MYVSIGDSSKYFQLADFKNITNFYSLLYVSHSQLYFRYFIGQVVFGGVLSRL